MYDVKSSSGVVKKKKKKKKKKRGHSEGLRLFGRIILKFIVKKSLGMAWIGLIWLRTGTSRGP